MRKKSLRAMESAVFQAPESRAEAIMQNILGANNVLVPPEAPFEEILQAILYNTPYTKEAEARIEEILLAIKNNGTYDGKGESRDEEILISKLNQTPYTKDAESRIEELFILWAAQSIVKQLEGVPPLAFTAQGQPLINLTIYGASGGVGDKTANLLDYTTVESTTNAIATQISGGISVSGRYYVQFSKVKFIVGNTYTMSWKANTTSGISAPAWRFHYADNTYSSMPSNRGTLIAEKEVTELLLYVSTTESCVVEFTEIMLNSGSTALPYKPFGYEIPISCGGETNTIYLDTPLYDGNSISMADTGIEIPTTNGQNTLAVDTTVQPEKVYIEYK